MDRDCRGRQPPQYPGWKWSLFNERGTPMYRNSTYAVSPRKTRSLRGLGGSVLEYDLKPSAERTTTSRRETNSS